MLSIDVSINNTQIRRIDAVNTGRTIEHGDHHGSERLSVYELTYYDFEAGEVEEATCYHNPDLGAMDLVEQAVSQFGLEDYEVDD